MIKKANKKVAVLNFVILFILIPVSYTHLNERLTKVYNTNHIVEAITVEKRCTGIARYRKAVSYTHLSSR